MIYSKDEVYAMCKKVAPAVQMDAKLLYAICLQEGGKTKTGEFAPDKARLEQGYYLRYVEKDNLSTTTEVLLAASFGIMQMMALSLKEVKDHTGKNYFEWYFNQQSDNMKAFLIEPLSDIAVVKAINYYCATLEVMIVWGSRWAKKKMDMAKGSLPLFCKYWNGDSTGKYYNELMVKYNSI